MNRYQLRGWRMIRGLSWAAAAEWLTAQLGADPPTNWRTWARWERGESAVPHWLPAILERWAEPVSVPAD